MSSHVSNIPSGLQHPSSRSSSLPDIRVGSRVSVADRKGVVRYIGTTQFAEGEWYGVCLDNAKGKNNGSVNGVRYFEADAKHGLFVKRAQVRLEDTTISAHHRRTTIGTAQTRILASSTTGSVTDTDEKKKNVEDKSLKSTPPPTLSHIPSSAVSINRAFNESEKQRELLLDSKKSVATTTTGDVSFDSNTHQPFKAGIIQGTLKGSPGAVKKPHFEAKSLGKKEEEETAVAACQADELKTASKLQGIAHELDEPVKTITTTDIPPIDPALISKSGNRKQPPDCLSDEVLEDASMMQIGDNIKVTTSRIQVESQKRNEATTDRENELKGAVEELKRKLKDASDMNLSIKEAFRIAVEEKGRENITNIAKEKAALASSARQIENLETRLSESTDTIEALALEKEELELENETLAEEIDQLKEELACCQLDLEHARLSAEEAKETEEQQLTKCSGSELSKTSTVEVNEKLREALKRLHQISMHDKNELTKLNRESLKSKQIRASLEEELVKLQSWKKEKEVELVALTEQVDLGTAFQSMVESLSDKCMSYEGLNDELRAQVSDLECSLELSEEIEERQAEELKSMRKELQYAEVAEIQRKTQIESLQTHLENNHKICDRLKGAAEELRCGMSELQLKLTKKSNELVALKQRIKALSADKHTLVNEAEVTRRDALLVAMSKLETAESRALSSRLRFMLPKGMTVLEVEEAVLSSEILASRVSGKCLIAFGMLQRLMLSWLRLQFEEGNKGDDVYNEDTFIQRRREAGVMDILMRVRLMALKSLLENVNGVCFSERKVDSDSECAEVVVAHSNHSNIQQCDVYLDELLRLLEKEGGLLSPDVFSTSEKDLEDIVSLSCPPVIGSSCSSSTTIDVSLCLQCQLSLSSVQRTATRLAVSKDAEERENKCKMLYHLCEGLLNIQEKLYCPCTLDKGLTTTTSTAVIICDSEKWLHDLQHLGSSLHDDSNLMSVGSVVERLDLTIPDDLVASEAILSLAGTYKLVQEGAHRSVEINAVQMALEKGLEKDEHAEVLQKELQAANVMLDEKHKALQSAMSQRFALENLLASKALDPSTTSSNMDLAVESLQCEHDKLLSEKKEFLEAIEMLQKQNGDLETKLLQSQEESISIVKDGGLSTMIAETGADGLPQLTVERRLSVEGQHLTSISQLPASTSRSDPRSPLEVEDLKRALKHARASAEMSCMNTAANLLTTLPPLHIVYGCLDDGTVCKQRHRKQQPPVSSETYNIARERIKRLKQLESQVCELQSIPKILRLGEGANKSLVECQSRSAVALKLYMELKRAQLQMKPTGERVVFSDNSKVSNTSLAITKDRPRSTRIARISIGSNNPTYKSNNTVTIPVVMGLSDLEQMTKSIMVPIVYQ